MNDDLFQGIITYTSQTYSRRYVSATICASCGRCSGLLFGFRARLPCMRRPYNAIMGSHNTKGCNTFGASRCGASCSLLPTLFPFPSHHTLPARICSDTVVGASLTVSLISTAARPQKRISFIMTRSHADDPSQELAGKSTTNKLIHPLSCPSTCLSLIAS